MNGSKWVVIFISGENHSYGLFQCYCMSYRVRAVRQNRMFPTPAKTNHSKTALSTLACFYFFSKELIILRSCWAHTVISIRPGWKDVSETHHRPAETVNGNSLTAKFSSLYDKGEYNSWPIAALMVFWDWDKRTQNSSVYLHGNFRCLVRCQEDTESE